MALSSCGGAPDAGETPTRAAAPDSADRATALAASTALAPPVGASGAAVVGVTLPRGSTRPPASPAAYDIRLLDQNGWHRETFDRSGSRRGLSDCARSRGAARVGRTVTGGWRATVLRHSVALRITCHRARGANYAERYTISLSDDSVARLSTTKDMIAINARQIAVERPSIVSVTLTVDGQPPVMKQIDLRDAARSTQSRRPWHGSAVVPNAPNALHRDGHARAGNQSLAATCSRWKAMRGAAVTKLVLLYGRGGLCSANIPSRSASR